MITGIIIGTVIVMVLLFFSTMKVIKTKLWNLEQVPTTKDHQLQDLIAEMKRTANKESIVCFRKFLIDNQNKIRDLTRHKDAAAIWAKALNDSCITATKRF